MTEELQLLRGSSVATMAQLNSEFSTQMGNMSSSFECQLQNANDRIVALTKQLADNLETHQDENRTLTKQINTLITQSRELMHYSKGLENQIHEIEVKHQGEVETSRQSTAELQKQLYIKDASIKQMELDTTVIK